VINFNDFPVIPVVVIHSAENAEPLAEALCEGGMRVVEITFRTDAAAEAISRIVRRFPEVLVGAGTVVTRDQAAKAIDAGARFGLAPGTDTETIRFFNDFGVPFIPGVATPSDIQTAIRAGCHYLKFFPAEPLGGIAMLKALSAPYANQGIQFCPTGGISIENMNKYLELPSVFAVGGSWIAPAKDIREKNWKIITENAKTASAQMKR